MNNQMKNTPSERKKIILEISKSFFFKAYILF